MIVTNQILGSLSRALGADSFQGDVSQITIPDAYVASAPLPQVWDGGITIGGTPPTMHKSFSVDAVRRQVAAGGVLVLGLCVLGRGVWDISVVGHMISDAQSIQTSRYDAELRLTGPTGNYMTLIGMLQGTDTMGPATRRIVLSLANDLNQMDIDLINPVTTYVAGFSVYAAKLL